MINPYLPYPVRIKDVQVATEDRTLRTYELEFLNSEDSGKFKYLPGQFAELSVAGYGESPIGIASSPTEGDTLLFTVSRAGKVTTKLHNMSSGDIMGIRGPMGHPYPLDEIRGKNIVIIAGGYAVTTLRSTMIWLLHPDNRDNYGKITFIYGVRTPGMLLYMDVIRRVGEERPGRRAHHHRQGKPRAGPGMWVLCPRSWSRLLLPRIMQWP